MGPWHVLHFCQPSTRADPNGRQLAILREALRQIINRDLVVRSELLSLAHQRKLDSRKPVFNNDQSISRGERQLIAQGYLWFDWFAIPQISVRKDGADPDMESDVRKAVDSIPTFAEIADMFVILCPSLRHQDTGHWCDLSTWRRRGWCRVEIAANMLARTRRKNVIAVKSERDVHFTVPYDWLFSPPVTGDFTVEKDREAVHTLMRNVLQDYLKYLQRSCGKHGLLEVRFFQAISRTLLTGRGDVAEREQTAGAVDETTDAFLQRYSFSSPQECGDLGFGPLACAVLEGNLTVASNLVAARADLEQQITQYVPELSLRRGDRPLVLAVLHNGSSDVVASLLALRASAASRPGQRGALHAAAFGNRDVVMQALLNHMADVTERNKEFGASPLDVACQHGSSECVDVLLRHRADPNERQPLGLTPLLSVCTFSHSLPCARLLVARQADVNSMVRAEGAWKFGMKALGVADSLGCVQSIAFKHYSHALGVTPVASAAAMGQLELLKFLLAQNADPTIRNDRRYDALDLAHTVGHDESVDFLRDACSLDVRPRPRHCSGLLRLACGVRGSASLPSARCTEREDLAS